MAQTFDGHWEVQVSSQRDSYDKTMLGIARAFPRLSSLGIAFRSDESCGPPPLCWCIGDEGLEALSRLKYLRSPHLPWCTGISPEVLAKVGQSWSDLRTADLSWCVGLDGEAISGLLENCVALRSINLSGCKIVDDTLFAVAASCPKLEVLQVVHCEGVTSQGISAVARDCRSLTLLNVTGCNRVATNVHDLVVLKALNTHVKIVKRW